MLPGWGVTPRTIPFIESQYTSFLAAFNTHLSQQEYALGLSHPTTADFALYGPLYQLYRDPLSGADMKMKAPFVAEWVEKMGMQIPTQAHDRVVLSSDQDTIRFVRAKPSLAHISPTSTPATVGTWLTILLEDFLPHLATVAGNLRRWTLANDLSQPVPRLIGNHKFTLRASPATLGREPALKAAVSVEETRPTSVYSVWMVQRIISRVYGADPQECDEWMKTIGGHEAVNSWKVIMSEMKGIQVERAGASVRVTVVSSAKL
jgi:hypothetical protein